MAEKPEENCKLENVGEAQPAGIDLAKNGEPQVAKMPGAPTEDSDEPVAPLLGGDATFEDQPSENLGSGDTTSSESKEAVGSSETPESGTAVEVFGGGGGSGDATSSSQSQGHERLDRVPPSFEETGTGYMVQIHGGGAHYVFIDEPKCGYVEMENGKEFHIELTNHNAYRCDVDVAMATFGSEYHDVGGWRLDAGQEFQIHNDAYGGGKFVFYSCDPGSRKEGDTNEKNVENSKSIVKITFIPEAHSIYFKMTNDKSVTNIRFLKNSDQFKFADVLKEWMEREKMEKDQDYSNWCFSDGHKIIDQRMLISTFADKQSIRKPLWLFKDKETISLKLDSGDKKEIQVFPRDFHYAELKEKVPELFGEGDLYEYEFKLKGKAISEENYLACLEVDSVVEVIKKRKTAVDPTTEGTPTTRGLVRGIGLTRGLGHANEGERGAFRGLGHRGGDDFEEEEEEIFQSWGGGGGGGFRDISPNVGVIRYEGEPVQAFETVSDGKFYTIPKHQVTMIIHLVS